MTESSTHINDLPSLVLNKVMSSLNFYHRQRAMVVCKRWYEALQEPQFLKTTSMKLDHSTDPREIPPGLAQRKIPNLKISFLSDNVHKTRVSPEVAVALPQVRHIHLIGQFDAVDIKNCVAQFKDLESLKIAPECVETIAGTLEDEEFKSGFLESMSVLQNLTFLAPYWHGGMKLVDMLYGLSSVERLILQYGPHDDHQHPKSPLTGHHLVQLLARTEITRHLHELDMRCFHMSHESFSVFLQMPNLNLRVLKFFSDDWRGGCQHLVSLGNSDLNLEVLEVNFEEQASLDVRYPTIRDLMVKKPLIRSIMCRGMCYDDETIKMAAIFNDWPNIDRLFIPNTFNFNSSNVEFAFLTFHAEAGVITLSLTALCNVLVRESLLALANSSPRLKLLNTGVNLDFPDPISVPLIADSFPSLTDLCIGETDVSNIHLGIPRGPEGEITRLRGLEVLNLGYCTNLTDADLRDICFPNLKYLWLSKSKGISDVGVSAVVSANPTLQLLGLGRCPEISDRSVEAIGEHLRYLRCLLIYDCHLITEGAAEILADRCQRLQFIDVSGCHGTFIKALRGLQGSMPFLCDIVEHKEFYMTPLVKSEWAFALLVDRVAHQWMEYGQ